ncbi:MAG: xanthine dehydrogenase family protein molybdopterin-binding subunit [Dehalococcoidia bacterium]|nr:xanthine dehydrogenase family protein molybdopterin-binding subunit [Dehalococcoidia bacterium]
MTTTKDAHKSKLIGTSPVRPDGAGKVTGEAIFAADVSLPGMLHGKILRSPHAHARIKSIDASEALKLPGVRAIATHQDFPPIPSNLKVDSGEYMTLRDLRDRVLASNKVLFKGHPVAGIVADNAHIAEEAMAKIKVEYEVLKSVTDVRTALKKDAPVLHDKLNSISRNSKLEQVSPNGLIIKADSGNVEQGFKECDVVIEREFTTQTVHQGYIEPQATVVDYLSDGSIVCHSCTQGTFRYREHISDILQIPQHKIKIVPTEIGGGFGGKEVAYLEPIAAILSKKTQRPVKIVMSRADVFQGTGPASGSWMKVKIGAKKDGKLHAAQMTLAYEGGAWPGSPVSGGASIGLGRYNIPNQLIEGYDVVLNKPATQPYRAPGATQIHFATETIIDEIAEKLGIDPVEFRMINTVREGDRNVQGVPFQRIGSTQVLEAIKNSEHYKSPLGGPNRGRGFAFGFWRGGGGQSSCNISVHPDGTVSMLEGSPDLSGTRTAIAMIAADTLGIPLTNVKIAVGDTDSVGYSMGSWGSRTTFATGLASYEAATDLNKKMTARAAKIWETTPDNVENSDGEFRHKSDSALKITFAHLAEKLNSTGGPIMGYGLVDPARGVGACFCANLVDVEVDPETGKVTILRFTTAQDVGRAIHKALVEGQMQGGVVQGIGWALNEEYVFDQNGNMSNPTFLDYRMPVALDVPMIESIVVEVFNPSHPYGVRGVGEDSITTPPGAIANAIYRATGVRMEKLPMSPTNIMEAMNKQKGRKN